jgi:hypothetical protein
MPETLTKTSSGSTLKRIYTVNNRPVHVHTCRVLAEKHEWECDSPYCEVMDPAICPEHGGFEPIAVGREPWRGR